MEYKKNYVPLYEYLKNLDIENENISKTKTNILESILDKINKLHTINTIKEDKNVFMNNLKMEIYDKIINRKKEGFVLPTDEWFRVDLKDFAYNSLDSKKLLRHGLINKNYVFNLLAEHSCGKINNGPKILNLIMFQKWWDKYID